MCQHTVPAYNGASGWRGMSLLVFTSANDDHEVRPAAPLLTCHSPLAIPPAVSRCTNTSASELRAMC